MRKIVKKHVNHYFTFANCIIFIGIITTLIYIFSYMFPVTDNAFVVNNVRPVAAQVHGYVTNIYIKNGDYVTKGQRLFTVFDKPYQYTYEQLDADVDVLKFKIKSLQKVQEKDVQIKDNKHDVFVKLEQDDTKYQKAYTIQAVSLMTLQNSQQETKAAKADWLAIEKQLEIDAENINVAKKELVSLTAKLKNAKVELDETTVYAENDGIIQNFYLTLGTPINVNQPLFSFIETKDIYYQANFNETDLRNVHAGDKVLIFPRTYLGQKVFHGTVVSDYWGANRLMTDPKTQMQNVSNENQWILLPQRLPVQIKVVDADLHYPLRAGTSAYIYIETN